MTSLELFLTIFLAITFVLWMRSHKGWTTEMATNKRLIDIQRERRRERLQEPDEWPEVLEI